MQDKKESKSRSLLILGVKKQANKRVQADAAAAAWYRAPNRLCDAAQLEADIGKLAARLTRRALDAFRSLGWIV
jgi:hypothetical protein